MNNLMLFGVWWLWWALGTFGLVGTGLMIWLAPTVLLGILKWAVTFCFTTRIGAALLAASIAFFVADVNRSKRDASEYAAKTAQFEQAQADRDKQIETDAKDQVWIEIANQTALNTTTDTEVKEFHDALPPIATTDACNDIVRVGSNAGKLRAIAGAPVSRPVRPQAVPKARRKAAGA